MKIFLEFAGRFVTNSFKDSDVFLRRKKGVIFLSGLTHSPPSISSGTHKLFFYQPLVK
jgi:hypothetical protein